MRSNLRDASSWFPRPHAVRDVEIVAPRRGLGQREVFDLLTDTSATEWKDKVGVVGRVEGSGKPSTRLLAVRGMVAKTDIGRRRASKREALHDLETIRSRGVGTGIWHRNKHWIVLRADNGWYPLTLCPELLILRRLQTITARMEAWTSMLDLALRTSEEHAIGLDVNPANFGIDRATDSLYYVDDELYGPLEARDIAACLVARIPEESTSPTELWQDWGQSLGDCLPRRWREATKERLLDELRGSPLATQFEACRTALLEGLKLGLERTSGQRRLQHVRPKTATVCVFADVHANLPALDAVLTAAREAGTDWYLFLGDVVGYGPHPAACIERLANLPRAILLRGNHDNAVATGTLNVGMNRHARRSAEWTLSILSEQDRDWLANLPLEHVEMDWMAVHGAPKDPARLLAYVYELTYEENLDALARRQMPFCFFGHTHVQLAYARTAATTHKLKPPDRVDLSKNAHWLINPGSVGQPRDGEVGAAFAIWDRGRQELSFRRIGYDVERTVRDLRARGLSDDLGRRLVLGM